MISSCLILVSLSQCLLCLPKISASNQTQEAYDSDGNYCLIQNDILVDCNRTSEWDELNEHMTKALTGRQGKWDDIAKEKYRSLTYRTGLWKLPVRYRISKYLSYKKDMIKSAMRRVEYKTCIRYQELDESETPVEGTFLDIIQPKQDYCATRTIGYAGKGKHLLELGGSCVSIWQVAHELLHSLGFEHEHARPDRDKYIQILFRNTVGKQNFARLHVGVVPYEKYEYDAYSIMHYGLDFGAKDMDYPVMIPIRKDVDATAFGYRNIKYYKENIISAHDYVSAEEDDERHPKYKQFLSPMDRMRVNDLYCSDN